MKRVGWLTIIMLVMAVLFLWRPGTVMALDCCNMDDCASLCDPWPNNCSYACNGDGPDCDLADDQTQWGICAYSVGNTCTLWCNCGPCIDGYCGQLCCDGVHTLDYQIIACDSSTPCPNCGTPPNCYDPDCSASCIYGCSSVSCDGGVCNTPTPITSTPTPVVPCYSCNACSVNRPGDRAYWTEANGCPAQIFCSGPTYVCDPSCGGVCGTPTPTPTPCVPKSPCVSDSQCCGALCSISGVCGAAPTKKPTSFPTIRPPPGRTPTPRPGTPTPTPTRTPTPTPMPAGPWWQVVDGDVQTNGDLNSAVPGGYYFNLPGLGGFPGVAKYGGSTTISSAKVSERHWIANSLSAPANGRVQDYAYFRRLIPEDVVLNPVSLFPSGGTASNGYYWYEYDGSVTGLPFRITSSVNLPVGRKVVLLVTGADLNIEKSINYTSGESIFVALVDGNINIDSDVGNAANFDLMGFFLADGNISTGDSSLKSLHLKGSVAALGSLNLQRNLGASLNPTQASEVFEYDPATAFLFPPKLSIEKTRWKEVAP